MIRTRIARALLAGVTQRQDGTLGRLAGVRTVWAFKVAR